MARREIKQSAVQNLRYNPITPRMGAVGSLIEFNDGQMDALVELAAESVVIVRDQDMTPQQQAEFAHRLGRPLTTSVNKGKSPEELLLIQANEKS